MRIDSRRLASYTIFKRERSTFNNQTWEGMRGSSIEAECARIARRTKLRHIRADLPSLRLRKNAGVSTRRQALTVSARHYWKGEARNEARTGPLPSELDTRATLWADRSPPRKIIARGFDGRGLTGASMRGRTIICLTSGPFTFYVGVFLGVRSSATRCSRFSSANGLTMYSVAPAS
jgi:hypothetical protein